MSGFELARMSGFAPRRRAIPRPVLEEPYHEPPTSQEPALVRVNGHFVSPALSSYVQRLRQFARQRGWSFHITSGYRSLAEQDRLRVRFESGDPNIVFPPAKFSYHTLGLAIDVESDHLPELGAFAESIGMRWGGRFGDPVHFDLGRRS